MQRNHRLIALALVLALLLPVLPAYAADDLVWDFSDASLALQGWGVEGSWAYAPGFSADNLAYDAERGALRLSPLQFDASVSWSEVKLNIPLPGFCLTGYRVFELTIVADSAAYHAGGGSFKVQPIAIMGDGTYEALVNGDPASVTEENGMVRLEYQLPFVSGLTVQSITVGIAGVNTAFAGDLYIPRVALRGLSEGVYTGVDATISPINGRDAIAINPQSQGELAIVDPNATALTKSLFSYLLGVQGEYMLFGHQNAMHHGVSVRVSDGSQSDALHAVGAHPAVIGIDGLSIVSGSEGTYEGSVRIAKAAYLSGCVLTVSMHMPNFTTGGHYDSISENAIADVLPGGKSHAKLTAYLDTIAQYAKDCVTPEGAPIPIILRPYHENNGAWFWWGTAGGTAKEYIALYRFTVEYLRDTKGVHNFLYAYSPNGPIGNESVFMRTYPGDNYVDILGLDYYCINRSANTNIFFIELVNSCRVVSEIAARKGKPSALCETGISQNDLGYGGLAPRDNGACTTWFTDLKDKIFADPVARNISYMLVWANFSDKHFWLPYAREGEQNSHEMIDDLIGFYNDDRVVFADRTGDIWSHGDALAAAGKRPEVELVTPEGRSFEATGSLTVKARVDLNGYELESLTYTIRAFPDIVTELAFNPDSGLYEAVIDLKDIRSSYYDTTFTAVFSDGDRYTLAGVMTFTRE